MKIHSAIVALPGHLMLKGAIVLDLGGTKKAQLPKGAGLGDDILSPFPVRAEHDYLRC